MTTNKELGDIEPVDISSLWGGDLLEFSRWLSENLKLVGEPLHMDLELVRLQPPSGWFDLNIIAKEVGSDATVVIVSQLHPSSHSRLGQLVGYAATQDARILIWVAPEFRAEHRKALELINERSPDEVEVYGLEVRAIRIGCSLPAHEFRPVVFADAWAKRVRSAMHNLTPAAQKRFDFFQPLLENLWHVGFTNRTTARTSRSSNENFASGFSGISYNAGFNWDQATVYLWIYTGNVDKDKLIYEGLLRDAESMKEQMTGLELDLIGRLGGWRRVSVGIATAGTLDQADDALSNIREWMLNNLLKLKEICEHRLSAIICELEAAETAANSAESGYNPGNTAVPSDNSQAGTPTPADFQEG